jgi:hypothetical protein
MSLVVQDQIANIWINLNMSVADKGGQQSCLGYILNAEISLPIFDCRLLGNCANDIDYNVSGPLICNCLSYCEKLIPAFLMLQICQQLTLDRRANFIDNVHVSAFTISNIQISYQLINFGEELQNMIMYMPKFIIKSGGWSNSAISVGAGTIGSQLFFF